MKVYHVTMHAGGTVRLGADRYTAGGKVRFYQGTILRSEFPAEEIDTISEEQDEAATQAQALVTTDAGVLRGNRS